MYTMINISIHYYVIIIYLLKITNNTLLNQYGK